MCPLNVVKLHVISSTSHKQRVEFLLLIHSTSMNSINKSFTYSEEVTQFPGKPNTQNCVKQNKGANGFQVCFYETLWQSYEV